MASWCGHSLWSRYACRWCRKAPTSSDQRVFRGVVVTTSLVTTTPVAAVSVLALAPGPPCRLAPMETTGVTTVVQSFTRNGIVATPPTGKTPTTIMVTASPGRLPDRTTRTASERRKTERKDSHVRPKLRLWGALSFMIVLSYDSYKKSYRNTISCLRFC